MIQLSMFEPKSDWQRPESLPHIPEGATVAVDLETKDPLLFTHGPGWCYPEGKILGVSIAYLDEAHYYPIDHPDTENMPVAQIITYLRNIFHRNEVVFANATYDLGWLQTWGIEHPDFTKVHDVQIQAPLLNEYRRSYSLDNLGKDFLNSSKNSQLLDEFASASGIKNPMGSLDKIPARFVGPYAEQDARLTLQLYNLFKREIIKEGLQSIYQLEQSQLPVLLAMRARGINVNLDKAEALGKHWKVEEDLIAKRLRSDNNLNINPNSSHSVALLLRRHGVKDIPTTDAGNPSINHEYLTMLSNEGLAAAGQIIRWKKINKARSTFVENAILGHAKNGKVHASFTQLRGDEGGTVTGRFSSSNPCLHQQPSPEKDPEIGTALRSCFEPIPGEKWVSLDYSSQEPRITLEYAHIHGIEGAEKLVNEFRDNPRTDIHQRTADLAGIERKPAKTVNLALAYGAGEASICNSLGFSTVPTGQIKYGKKQYKAGPEGRRFLDRYHQAVPFMRGAQFHAQDQAERDGYIYTMLMRKCRFNDIGKSYRALNRYVQGSAADQMKKAMSDLHKEGFIILVTMHDEVGLSIYYNEQIKTAVDIMEHTVRTEVPHRVDVAVGTTWGDVTDV